MKTQRAFEYILKTAMVVILSVTLPVSTALPAVPDSHDVIADLLESAEESASALTDQASDAYAAVNIPVGDLLQPSALISNEAIVADVLEGTALLEEADFETAVTEDLLSATEEDGRFWTGKKILVVSSALLLTGVLVGLLALLGGGGGSGGGGAGDGGSFRIPLVFVPPPDGCDHDCDDGGGLIVVDNGGQGGGDVPVNPEPATFLLMGLGLIFPFLRRKS